MRLKYWESTIQLTKCFNAGDIYNGTTSRCVKGKTNVSYTSDKRKYCDEISQQVICNVSARSKIQLMLYSLGDNLSTRPSNFRKLQTIFIYQVF